jgi:uncharacterized protein YdeI (YjbR/CyaY-like superfamily)
MATTNLNPKVDAYIAKAQPFAQPILIHIRKLVHKGCPQIEETIKWSRPFFEYKGNILCNMSGFKEHCSLGFWGQEIAAVLREAKLVSEGEGMGTFGKITRIKDLPPEKEIVGWVKQAAIFVDDGTYTSPISARRTVVKPAKPTLKTPPEFSAALKKSKKAAAAFEKFSPSCKREYIEWIAEAKRLETREKRVATAVEWIAEGKQRNWKYQNC